MDMDLKIKKMRKRKTETAELLANEAYALEDDAGENYRLHLSAIKMAGDTYIIGRHDESGMPAFWTLRNVLDTMSNPNSLNDAVLDLIVTFVEKNDIVPTETLEDIRAKREEAAENAPSFSTEQMAAALLGHIEHYEDLAIRTDDSVGVLGALRDKLEDVIVKEE